MKCAAAQQREGHNANNQRHQSNCQCNAENVVTLDHVAPLSCCSTSSKGSKGLTQSDKKLCGLKSGNRIQVLAYVNPHGTDARLVTQAQADGVAVIA